MTIELVVHVGEDRAVTLQLPESVAPGEHHIQVTVDDKDPEAAKLEEQFPIGPLGFHLYPGDTAAELGSLRREDLYGDDGR